MISHQLNRTHASPFAVGQITVGCIARMALRALAKLDIDGRLSLSEP
ncbi:hypothetical protein IMCC9480_1166 [Oxalobacteraceae bacterium IMCC9480]|nr:hypothetical protein IMCC9480_1166 [Oxalobacteraceae bacterium IMCC9480]